MPKKILLILGHPDASGLCGALATAYVEGAQAAGAEVKEVHLGDLQFDPILRHGYRERMELEPDLLKVQEDIRWAEHIVLVYPFWWAGPPALLKGLFDRAFLPGFAFKYRENSPLPERLLKGKTARLLVTMDSPAWYVWLFYGLKHRSVSHGTLQFSGIKPVRVTNFSRTRFVSDDVKKEWLEQVKRLGNRGE